MFFFVFSNKGDSITGPPGEAGEKGEKGDKGGKQSKKLNLIYQNFLFCKMDFNNIIMGNFYISGSNTAGLDQSTSQVSAIGPKGKILI